MYKRKDQGFGAVELILILVIVAIIGFLGYRLWQANADSKTENTTSNNTISQTTADLDHRVVTESVADNISKDIHKQLSAFYKQALIEQDKDSLCVGMEQQYCGWQLPYISSAAASQLKQQSPASLISCGQEKTQLYSIGKPEITEDKAVVKVTVLPLDNPLSVEFPENTLSLMMQDDVWKIDKFACE